MESETILFIFIFQDIWLGVLHHVCGEHKWATSECSHGDLSLVNEPKEALKKDSNAIETLRKVILDPRFVDGLKFYTRFR